MCTYLNGYNLIHAEELKTILIKIIAAQININITQTYTMSYQPLTLVLNLPRCQVNNPDGVLPWYAAYYMRDTVIIIWILWYIETIC